MSQWNGFSPRDTQRYLCNVWAKVRAAISRAGFHVFGFRVVESHHDGTPHWHMLRFIRPHDIEAVRDILCYHARIADSEELQTPNAPMARFHVEPIDPAKGSSTLMAGAIQQVCTGDYSQAVNNRVAAVQQQIIAPVVWIGSGTINVAQLTLDTLDVVKELAEQTASHTHSNTGASNNAGAIGNTGTKAETLNGKYPPVIGQ